MCSFCIKVLFKIKCQIFILHYDPGLESETTFLEY